MIQQNHNRRSGAIVILVAVCLFVLIAVIAIAIDGGLLFSDHRRVQAAADASALAAASDLYQKYWTNSGQDDGGALQSALSTAASNGYTNDGEHSIVTVNIPPQSGRYVNRRGYTEVIIQYNQWRAFSSIFAGGSIPVRARAVSLGAAVAADVGILVLDPDDKSAFNAQGSGITNVGGTPVVVNSNHPEAAIAGGGGTVMAPKYFITGGVSTSGGGVLGGGPIFTGRPGLPDPLADLPIPDSSQMSLQSAKKTQHTSGTINLQPGVYQGGINVSGTASLNLAPGIYYMDGGGFSFSGQGNLHGEGVMIYNDPGNGNSDGISVTGQGSLVLSGPDSGTYQGVTFFQDRTRNVTGNVQGTGGQTSITGTFYFAGALLKVSGNGGVVNLGSQYISRKLELGGNGDINIDWKPDDVARARTITLVE